MKIPQEVLTMREADFSYNLKEGVCKFNNHNSEIHELAKAKLMIRLMRNGHKVYSEVIWKNKSRSDLVSANVGVIHEILASETLEQAKRKEKYYPSSLMIEYWRAEDIVKDNF